MAHDELKKGSTELLILALLDGRPRHGYEIGKLIEARSPVLCRLEDRGLITGRWRERAGERRRRFYRLTADGRDVLRSQRTAWEEFSDAVNQILRNRHA
jgi:PadR family transcriptional regulator, regulatory protein PadR